MESTTSPTSTLGENPAAATQPSSAQHELTESERKELKAAYDEYQKKMHYFRLSTTSETMKHEGVKERNSAFRERERQADERFKEKPKRPSMEELIEGMEPPPMRRQPEEDGSHQEGKSGGGRE